MVLSVIILVCLALGAASLVITAFRETRLSTWWRVWLYSLGGLMTFAVVRVFVR